MLRCKVKSEAPSLKVTFSGYLERSMGTFVEGQSMVPRRYPGQHNSWDCRPNTPKTCEALDCLCAIRSVRLRNQISCWDATSRLRVRLITKQTWVLTSDKE